MPEPIETVPPAVIDPATTPAARVFPRKPPPARLPIVSVPLFRSRTALSLFARVTVPISFNAPPPETRTVPSLSERPPEKPELFEPESTNVPVPALASTVPVAPPFTIDEEIVKLAPELS